MAKKKLTVPEKHQLKIAKQTLKYSDVGASIMGGMTKDEARAFLKKVGYSDREIKKLEENLTVEDTIRNMIRDAIVNGMEEQELDEMSSVNGMGGGDAYMTPAAFVGKSGKQRKERWHDIVTKRLGYEKVGEEEDADELGAGAKKKSNYIGKKSPAQLSEELTQINDLATFLDNRTREISQQLGYKLVNDPDKRDWDDLKNAQEQSLTLRRKFAEMKQQIGEGIITEKLSFVAYCKAVGIDPKKFKKTNPHGYDRFSKLYKKYSIEDFESSYGYLDAMEDEASKIPLENVNEGRRGQYQMYRDDPGKTAQQKIGESLQRMRRSLKELNKEVNLNLRLKNESGIESDAYWKRTKQDLYKISEHIHKLLEKIRRF